MSDGILEKEFLQIYQRYADAIFRYCYFRVYDRERAKDLTQEVFLRLWKQLATGNQISQPRAFLYTSSRHLIIDHVRKKKTESLELMEEKGFQPAVHSTERLQVEIDFQRARTLLGQLEEKYRESIWLRYVEGLPPREIAAMTGETPDTISVRIHRGLKQLRKNLE